MGILSESLRRVCLFSDLAGVWANSYWTFAFIYDSVEMGPYQQGFTDRWRVNEMEKVESRIGCYHVIKNKTCAYIHWLLPKLYVVIAELF